MMQASERTKIAQEVLDTHAENLKSEFSIFEERQDLFIDVFGNDIGSSEELAGLQNQFANGTLRPEVKFVSDEVLTDGYGNIRNAAFDREHQTILLSENLDAAGIESSIQQEIGHWWDVLLNGNIDTATEDGKPFDEGTAYAERFSEGVKGDNIFSDVVYQNDFHKVFVNGQETEVEFRPIASWNIQGNTNNNGAGNTLERVLDIMEAPGPGIGQIEVMALQEVTPDNLESRLRDIDGIDPNSFVVAPLREQTDPRGRTVFIREFAFERNNNNYLVFYNVNPVLSLGTAIVLRNPPAGEIRPFAFTNPTNPDNERSYLGVETEDGIYYSVHAIAGSGLNTGNDADAIIGEILNGNTSTRQAFILGDFNRNIATPGDPTGNIGRAFPLFDDILAPLNGFTQNARLPNPENTLDYMFTTANLRNGAGTVLNQFIDANQPAFPSDHFPVLYDDTIGASFEGGTVTAESFFPNLQTVDETVDEPSITAPLNEEGVEFPSLPPFVDFSVDFTGDSRAINGGSNRIMFAAANGAAFAAAEFNGYVFEFEGLRALENVALEELTNRTGVASNDITFDEDTIRVNLEGLSLPSNAFFELVVTFSDSFPG